MNQEQSLLDIYKRALSFLGPEKWLAMTLTAAGVIIAAVQLAEPVLFGRVVDALSKGEGALAIVGLWAALGIFGILANVVVAVFSDRLAHRRKLVVLADVYERAMGLSQSYHATRGSGAVVRTILSGATSLFWLWLGAMRDQVTAVFGILLLVPAAISMDYRMALILAVLAVVYVLLNVIVMRRTTAGQAAVENYDYAVSGRVVDVIGNVTIVQSYNRIGAEVAAMGGLMRDLLDAQYPVLTWWGFLAVIQRAASTLTMVAVFAMGAVLASRNELTVGQICADVEQRERGCLGCAHRRVVPGVNGACPAAQRRRWRAAAPCDSALP